MVNKALGKERVYFKWRLDEKERQLKEIITLAHSDKCYKTFILNHFGEEKEPCGNCANCLAEFKNRDFTREGQMILSTIYHTKGIYSNNIIASILLGRSTVKIKEHSLNKLSVFGLLKNEKEGSILNLITKLNIEEYIEIKRNNRFKETIFITDKGKSLLKGENKFILKEKIN